MFILFFILFGFTIFAEEIKIDQTYIINLDRTPERYRKTKEFLDEEKMFYVRFSATDGYKMNIKDLETFEIFQGIEVKKSGNKKFINNRRYKIECSEDFNFIYHTFQKNKGNKEIAKYPLAIGDIGCACSHLRVWNEMLNKNYENVLIFEDDIIPYDIEKDTKSPNNKLKWIDGKFDFWKKLRLYIWNLFTKKEFEYKINPNDSFKKNLDLVLQNTLPNCDAIFLYYHYVPPKFYKTVFKNPIQTFKVLKNRLSSENQNNYMERLYFINKSHFGALVAYVMTKKGAVKLLQHINNSKGSAIDALIGTLAENNDFNICAVKGNIVLPNLDESSIGEMGGRN